MTNLHNWDDLKFFYALANTGSLAKAARSLGVNHSTVFRRIEGLETELAVSLFHKLSTGYVLTPEGEELFDTVKKIENNLDLVSKNLTGKDTGLTGPIRIITTDSTGSILLPKYVNLFHERYPQISIELLVGTNYLEDYSVNGDHDIFVYAGVSPPEHWVGRRLGLMTFSMYAAKSYLEKYGTPSSLADLHEHSYISGSINLLHNWPAVKWLKENLRLFSPSKTVHSNSFAVVYHLLKEGLGLSIFSDAHCLLEPNLVKVFDFADIINSEVWVVTHPSIKDKARIRAFVDFLADKMIEDKVFS